MDSKEYEQQNSTLCSDYSPTNSPIDLELYPLSTLSRSTSLYSEPPSTPDFDQIMLWFKAKGIEQGHPEEIQEEYFRKSRLEVQNAIRAKANTACVSENKPGLQMRSRLPTLKISTMGSSSRLGEECESAMRSKRPLQLHSLQFL